MTRNQKQALLDNTGKGLMMGILVFLGIAWFISVLIATGTYDPFFTILIETISVVSALIVLFIDLFIAKVFYGIALDKGYCSKMYFW